MLSWRRWQQSSGERRVRDGRVGTANLRLRLLAARRAGCEKREGKRA